MLPRLLRLVTASGRREAFPLAILVASVGTAWLGSLMGLSMAVGAFLAGLMLAESEFSHQAYAEVRPVRDVLSGLFFISLGMLIDLGAMVGLLPRRRGRRGGDHRAEGRDRERFAPRGIVARCASRSLQAWPSRRWASSRSSSGAPDSTPGSSRQHVAGTAGRQRRQR